MLASLEPFRVTSAEVAEIFKNPLEIKRLIHFMPAEGSTASALARATHSTLNAAYRKVKKYEQLGLIVVLREEKRTGRAVKVYHCPHRSFLIPRSLIPMQEQITEIFEPYRQLMIHSIVKASSQGVNQVDGMLYLVTPGGLWMVPANEMGERWTPDVPGSPARVHSTGPLYLDYEDAKRLEAELYDLFDRYRTLRGSAAYLLHQVLTPIQVQEEGFALPQTGFTRLV